MYRRTFCSCYLFRRNVSHVQYSLVAALNFQLSASICFRRGHDRTWQERRGEERIWSHLTICVRLSFFSSLFLFLSFDTWKARTWNVKCGMKCVVVLWCFSYCRYCSLTSLEVRSNQIKLDQIYWTHFYSVHFTASLWASLSSSRTLLLIPEKCSAKYIKSN